MAKQRQIICLIMTFMALSSFGAKLQVIETDMTHVNVLKCCKPRNYG